MPPTLFLPIKLLSWSFLVSLHPLKIGICTQPYKFKQSEVRRNIGWAKGTWNFYKLSIWKIKFIYFRVSTCHRWNGTLCMPYARPSRSISLHRWPRVVWWFHRLPWGCGWGPTSVYVLQNCEWFDFTQRLIHHHHQAAYYIQCYIIIISDLKCHSSVKEGNWNLGNSSFHWI